MIPIDSNADRSGLYENDPCVICGKEVKNWRNVLLVHVPTWSAIHPHEIEKYNLSEYGAEPIGAACLRKHSYLKPYLQSH